MKKHAKKWLAMALSLSVACMMLPAVGFAAGNVASVDGTGIRYRTASGGQCQRQNRCSAG